MGIGCCRKVTYRIDVHALISAAASNNEIRQLVRLYSVRPVRIPVRYRLVVKTGIR